MVHAIPDETNPSGRRDYCAFLVALQMLSSVHMWSNLFGELSLIGGPGVTRTPESLKLQSDLSWLQSSHAVHERRREALIHRPGRAAGDEKAPMQRISLESGGCVGVANGWRCVLVEAKVSCSDACSCKLGTHTREQPSFKHRRNRLKLCIMHTILG